MSTFKTSLIEHISGSTLPVEFSAIPVAEGRPLTSDIAVINELGTTLATRTTSIQFQGAGVLSTSSIEGVIHVTIPGGGSGGGGIGITTYAALSDAATVNLPAVNTPLSTALDSKQSTLVSGTSIKTVNGTSLLGSGDIDSRLSIVGTSSSIYSITKSDHNKLYLISSSSTTNISILTDAAVTAAGGVPAPNGTVVCFGRDGLGSVVFVPASGVTVKTPSSLTIGKQYGKVTLIRTDTDTWDLEGNLL
jgi:hypothetical protein